jgi:hypothetical protein
MKMAQQSKAPLDHSKRKHSDYAASSSDRWLNCHGSIRLSRSAPAQKDSPYAIEGTKAHECLEYIVKRYSNIEKAKAEALKKYPEDMVEHALTSAKVIFDLKPSKNAKLIIEERVHLKQVGPGLFGTLDYAWVDTWGELTVIDYKYGQGVAVYPADEDGRENSQLMYYAAGIAHKYNYEFDSVKLVIVQPRVWNEEGLIFREFKTTVGKLRKFEKEVKIAVAVSKTPNAILKAGDWCKWCPAATTCPEISDNQMRNADIFMNEESGALAVPEVKALSVERLPKILDACDILEGWIDKVREHAFNLAKDGTKIEGRKLVQKRTTRVWLPEAEKTAKKLYGDLAFSKPELLSPAQLEKAVGKEAKEFTDKHTTNISSGVTLVSESDKRPEVKDAILFEDL